MDTITNKPNANLDVTDKTLDQMTDEEIDALDTSPELEQDPDLEEKPEKKVETPAQPPAKTQKEIDWENKFKNSAREAQLLTDNKSKIIQTLDNVDQLPEPTEDELRAAYPNYDMMTDVEKEIVKDNVKVKRQFNAVKEVVKTDTKNAEERKAWIEKVDEFISDEITVIRYPELAGRERKFRVYAQDASKQGIPMEIVVKNFLYDYSKLNPAKKGSMFNGNSNGQPINKNDGKITAEQARQLRLTDNRKYQQLVREGKIDL